jgi:CSLREA domain-containing protein
MGYKTNIAIPIAAVRRIFLVSFLFAASFFTYIGLTQITENVFADATITVDSSADNATASDGLCTLREAILNSNADSDTTSGDCVAGSGNDTIEFDITTNEGAGPHVISVSTDLPELNDTVVISGYSETGAAENTAVAPAPFDGTIMIQLDGGGTVDRGFWAGTGSGGSTISGLSITGFAIDGILLEPADGQTVTGNYVGVQPDGSTADANGNGISINNSDNDTIGGTSAAARNIIAGNSNYGIHVNASLFTSTGTQILGNYVGVAANGTTDLGNGSDGIEVDYNNATIGGTTSGATNVISGNGGDGVRINARTNTTLQGNYIGTTYTGNADLGNTLSGISIHGGGSNVVGGSTSSARNVLSGNDDHGVFLASDSDENTISGNYIGVGANGTADVGNTDPGVSINSSSSSNLIGGTTSGEANVIKRNDSRGVAIAGASSTANAIIGNSLSRNSAPNIDLGNDGITVNDANDSDSGANDLLNYPVWGLFDDDSGDTEVTYDLDVPAGQYRVETFSDNGSTLVDSQNITHTGSGSEEFSNTISGNGYNSLRMTVTEIDAGETSGFGSTSEYSDAYSDSTTTITVNSIADDEADDGECTLREAITAANNDSESGQDDGECGAGSANDTIEFDIAGVGPHTIQPSTQLPDITDDGLTINGYSETGAVENSGDYSACFVGTIMIELDGTNTTSDHGLFISADNVTVKGLAINRFDENGITITADDAVVAGNLLGLDTDGLVDQGNGDAGVQINTTGSGLIGGTTAADRNVISGNQGFGGVNLNADAGTTTVSGNCIGTDVTGDSAIPNNHYGINLYQAAASTVIGGNTTHERNIISGNDEQGISADESSIESIIGNYIGVDVDGVADLGNGTDGIYADGDSSVSYIGGVTSGERNVVSGNGERGISLDTGTSGVTVRGNYVGLGADGITDIGNTNIGINTLGDNTIGGTVSGARNVVSGNGNNGIYADNSTIIGNYIGLSADGTTSVTNGDVNRPNVNLVSDNQFGGTSLQARNYIASDGTANGIGISGTTPFGGSSNGDNVVQGNCIGTNTDCEVEAGFGVAAGMLVTFDTLNNVIGGAANGAGNTIAGNREGILFLSLSSGPGFHPLNNSILGNSIYSNTGGSVAGVLNAEGIGIDLLESPDFSSFPQLGVNANDVGDGDTGGNDYLNFPVLDSSSATTGELDVQFDLDVDGSAPNGYRVEFFANDTGDASGNGEGQFYLGSHNVAGDVTNEQATIILEPGVITTGTYDITATVTERDNSTDSFGATSEFSAFLDNQNVIQPLDNDGDGVSDSIEDDGPNGGDGNDDGTPDSEQQSVATILDAESDDYITLALDPNGACTDVDDFDSLMEEDLPETDTEYAYPLTLTEFTIPCDDNVDGTLYWHGEENFNNHTYRKYGPTTPGDTGTNAWYDASDAAFAEGQVTIDGDDVATVNFSLTDGSLGDDTGDDNQIIDANGPGFPIGVEEDDSVIDDIAGGLAETGNNERVLMLVASMLIGAGILVGSRQLKRVKQAS